ncbi:MAG: hypothetical protein KAJ03_00240 [Gammaproteobacteria bacterium]|nr:hypothetical protein [Gammaproteobacteria bacterium]
MKYKIRDRGTSAFIRGTIDNDGTVYTEYEEEITEHVDVLYYTGKHDAHDVEFCVGDLVQFEYDTGYSHPKTIGIVSFGEHVAGCDRTGENIHAVGFYVSQLDVCEGQEWGIGAFDDRCMEIEIIGNKYENVDLMP